MGVRVPLVPAGLGGGRDLSWADGLPQALAGLRASGVATVLCTGRMFRSARRVAARLGLTAGPVICYQGALVADLGTGEWRRHMPMGGEVAAEVVRHVAGMGRQINAYIEDKLCVDEVTDWARLYAEHVEVGIHTVPDLEEEVRRRPPTKLVLVTAHSDADEILPGLQERWCERLYVVRSQPEYIEFADAGVSKSGALEWLCRGLGIARDAVAALGDGMNDVDMLRWAGVGVAVAEAAEPVRAAADIVVPRADVPALLRELAHRA